MKKRVQAFVKQCDICQRQKYVATLILVSRNGMFKRLDKNQEEGELGS